MDGIEVYIIAGRSEDGTWNTTAGVTGVEYIGVDKNHDLSYYVNGSDYVNSDNYNTSPGTFGYEWGGSGTETGIQDTAVGTGLTNTNALIGMNLQPETEGWWVVWDKVMDFRSSYGHNWFVPSKDELNLIYENRANLSNLSFNTRPSYWSSSEDSSVDAWFQSFRSGDQSLNSKIIHNYRVRLCVQFTQVDIE